MTSSQPRYYIFYSTPTVTSHLASSSTIMMNDCQIKYILKIIAIIYAFMLFSLPTVRYTAVRRKTIYFQRLSHLSIKTNTAQHNSSNMNNFITTSSLIIHDVMGSNNKNNNTNIPLALALLFLSSYFDNHLWRIICLFVQYNVMYIYTTTTTGDDNDDDGNDDSNNNNNNNIIVGNLILYVLTSITIWYIPHYANLRIRKKRQRRFKKGCIFITGCDSGMGKATAIELVKSNNNNNTLKGDGNGNNNDNSGNDNNNDNDNNNNNNIYEQIFAGCYDPKAALLKYEEVLNENELKYITFIELDVTDNDSVNEAAHIVHEWIYNKNKRLLSSPNKKKSKDKDKDDDVPPQVIGLTGIIQYHGVAFNGPSLYMPIDMYGRQMDVNFLGTIRIVQAFMPLMKQSIKDSINELGNSGKDKDKDLLYRGRIILTGTGGGSCSPCPPLLTAYMSSKFALEAYTQSLRQELYMTSCPIDVSIINPGFVKPTMLIEEGTKISKRMWKSCEDKLGSNIAKDEYGNMLDHFTEYSALTPGTHVSKIVDATTQALLSNIPKSSYKVGIDSKLAPIVGMMPTGVRELITRHGIYGILSPVPGTISGYKV